MAKYIKTEEGYKAMDQLDIATKLEVEEYVDGAISRVKIYTQTEEPVDAEEGTLWLDLDEESSSGISLPPVTANDAGKFLRVSADGQWIVDAVRNAEGVEF